MLKLLHQVTTKDYQNLGDLLKNCIQFGCQSFSMDVGMTGYFLNNQYHVQSVNSNWLSVEKNMDIPIKDTFCNEVYRLSKTISFENAPAHHFWQKHEAYNKFGIKSYIGTPIKVFDKVYGSLCFFSKEVREINFTVEDRAIIEIMANFIARKIELEEQKESLASKEKLAAFGQMVGGIAHEINNPMAIISSNNEFILNYLSGKGELDQDIEESLIIINHTVDRIRDIVSGLKVIMGGGQNPIEWVSLKEITDMSISLVMDKAEKLDVEIKNEIDPSYYVYANKVQLSQVLINLLQNSMDAIAGKEERWIYFSAHRLSHETELSVKDSGTGISEDIADKMMEPLFTTKKVGEGTGLGLSLCQQMLQQFGGELYYDEKESHTCFKLRLSNKLSQMKVS